MAVTTVSVSAFVRLLAGVFVAVFGSLCSCASVAGVRGRIVLMIVPIVRGLLVCAPSCLPGCALPAQLGERSLPVRKSGGRAFLVDGADARAGARHRLPGPVKKRRQLVVARRARDQQVGVGRACCGGPAAPLELRLDRESGGRGARPGDDERVRSA